MEKTDYLKIIQKYIKPDSYTYGVYITHVTLVTKKALDVGRRLSLSGESLRFIEEAGMLHDIGIARVHAPLFGCNGELPYICHITEGRDLLLAEGLPKHARVAERHTGVGVFADDVRREKMPIPEKDYVAETLEEEIISWADIFFSKFPDQLWRERSIDEARGHIAQFGEKHARIFDEWRGRFESRN